MNSQKTGISQDKKASVAFLASVGSIASIKRERRDVRERREGTGKRHEDGKMGRCDQGLDSSFRWNNSAKEDNAKRIKDWIPDRVRDDKGIGGDDKK